eukprot:2165964-Prymnesium_polylepis.2
MPPPAGACDRRPPALHSSLTAGAEPSTRRGWPAQPVPAARVAAGRAAVASLSRWLRHQRSRAPIL